ncbi:hypothetical protein PSHT_14979 [Puccinia striiformis]|uniref:Uncharacterized protein n=1 Tax=Puccinia striiformis TaxID=27350 RepID=A0A2S4UHA7_9BASI|nr:hypothetical protein PSHT_14979 [Puccinia striiformis]
MLTCLEILSSWPGTNNGPLRHAMIRSNTRYWPLVAGTHQYLVYVLCDALRDDPAEIDEIQLAKEISRDFLAGWAAAALAEDSELAQDSALTVLKPKGTKVEKHQLSARIS